MSEAEWIDLAACGRQYQEVQADVCVIGAGAAGIYLTKQMVEQGRSVILLEAGPSKCTEGGTIGFDVLSEGAPYPGAAAGRFFGMGGSTSRWGGALVPHTQHDLRTGSASNDVWAHIVNAVSARAPQVLRQLGYCDAINFDGDADRLLGPTCRALVTGGLRVQAALYLPFRFRNLVTLLHKTSHPAAAPRVFFNAVAKAWTLEAGRAGEARVDKVVAVSRNHNELTVRAGKYVVTAGAIESARILLEIDESASQRVFRPTAAIGCYLADHLSVPIADVTPGTRGRAAALFSPRFSGAWTRSFRFLDGSPALDAPRAFAHFIFSGSSRGFDVAREVLGAWQARRMPSLTAASVAAGLGDLVRLGYCRFINSALYIPAGTPAHLQLDMEQVAVRDNCVSLTSQRDAYGRLQASIRWQVTDIDMAQIETSAHIFLAKWPGASAGLPQLQPRIIGTDGTKPYSAYHPVGTCRMGDDAEAVVDRHLKVWGMSNLWVSSTGVLPSAGTANPTFTMLCLTQDLAEHFRAVS